MRFSMCRVTRGHSTLRVRIWGLGLCASGCACVCVASSLSACACGPGQGVLQPAAAVVSAQLSRAVSCADYGYQLGSSARELNCGCGAASCRGRLL